MLRIALAAQQRLANEHNGRAWLAHTIIALDRQKRLQRLDTLLIKRRAREQTWQEQMTICRAIAAYYRGKRSNG